MSVEIWAFRLVLIGFVGWFAMQMAVRARLWRPRLRAFRLDHLGGRFDRFFSEVIFQTRVIRERPVRRRGHLFVFWGFCAFGGFTAMEALRGLGLVDVTHTSAAHVYRLVLVPFALVVIAGMLYLLVRRALWRPAALGATVSKESVLIGFFILTLMVTFLLTFRLTEGTVAARVNW
jgi:hypothetical protein